MTYKGISVDVEYCTGCMSCVIACQQEHKYETEQYGIEVLKLGPLLIEEDHWEFDWTPRFTDFCDLCEHRVSLGKTPSCVQHCQAACLEFGSLEDLVKTVKRRKTTIIAISKD
jgi:anaerobic dimethyl sulfoxide reductase subunit B (iron-sulfur subunit)